MVDARTVVRPPSKSGTYSFFILREHEVRELISTLVLIQSDHDHGDVVFAPRPLFVRISRILEVTAELTADANLSCALRNDAILAEAGTKVHRWEH